jgi:formylglycine-generating enzyme required for sulfatase activity
MNKYLQKICWFLPLLFFCGTWERDNPVDENGINWNPPVVTAMKDTTVNINDSVTITVATTGNGTGLSYIWAKDGERYRDTSTTCSLKVAFATIGKNTVRICAINADSIVSAPDSCTVWVTLDPPTVIAMQNTTTNTNDSLTITATGKDNGIVTRYMWARNGVTFDDTTTTCSLRVAFTISSNSTWKFVIVKVIDDDGLISMPDSCAVWVTLDQPTVSAMRDTIVSIKDEIIITATAMDNGKVKKYVWSRDDGIFFSDSTITGEFKVSYSDSGGKIVIVKVIDDDGLVSKPDTCIVQVNLNPPSVVSLCDTTVNVNDSIMLTATAIDNGSVEKYVWAKNGVAYVDTTTSGSFKAAWPSSGNKIVYVKVIDDDGIVSTPYSCNVLVMLAAPVVLAHRDTVVDFATTKSVTVTVSAIDTNAGGHIVKYYWDVGSNGWDDSTAVPSFVVMANTGGSSMVRWAVLDDDGLLVLDTFVVRFNRAPENAMLTAPAGDLSWTAFNQVTKSGTLQLALFANDIDGVFDTLRYRLSIGNHPDSLTLIFDSTLARYDTRNKRPNDTIFWHLTVSDLYGDSTVALGTFISPSRPPVAGMVLIPGGTFQMGQNGIAEPIHSVTVSSFWMDTTEVTQADYVAIAGYSQSAYEGDLNPANSMTWYDAVLFCNSHSKRDGFDTVYSFSDVVWHSVVKRCIGLTDLEINYDNYGYRLPTEAEWEYACRAGTKTEYSWGAIGSTSEYAWFSGNMMYQGLVSPHPVATKLPNEWGLFDMAGNITEWTNDWFGGYSSSTQSDPTGPNSGGTRVCRGAPDNINTLAAAYRISNFEPGNASSFVGFRVVLPER